MGERISLENVGLELEIEKFYHKTGYASDIPEKELIEKLQSAFKEKEDMITAYRKDVIAGRTMKLMCFTMDGKALFDRRYGYYVEWENAASRRSPDLRGYFPIEDLPERFKVFYQDYDSGIKIGVIVKVMRK